MLFATAGEKAFFSRAMTAVIRKKKGPKKPLKKPTFQKPDRFWLVKKQKEKSPSVSPKKPIRLLKSRLF
jgi:hypothetical protein